MSLLSDACVKCAKCVPSCTIHEIHPDETTSPRGFLDLLAAYKRGQLPLDGELKRIFESCFLCTNCVQACPTQIRVDAAIEEAREDIAAKFGLAWHKRLILALLRHRPLLDLAAKFGYVFQSCAFKIERGQGMAARISLPLIKRGRFITHFNFRSFLNSNPAFIDNGGERTVGVFLGCFSNYFYLSTPRALLKIAKRLKINVDLLPRQACCGAPHLFTGDATSVEILAQKNIAYLEEKLKTCEAILIPEATCAAMVRVDWEHFFHARAAKHAGETREKYEKWASRARAVASKIFMASEYLARHSPLAEILTEANEGSLSHEAPLITYHDPCHARKMLGIFKEPRALLSRSGYGLVELSEPEACCGFGGVSMQTEQYERTLAVGLKKAQMIDATGARTVSAECGACRMQISNALKQAKSPARFAHPLELIAARLEG